jgi:hypothetical protein
MVRKMIAVGQTTQPDAVALIGDELERARNERRQAREHLSIVEIKVQTLERVMARL